jgi:hypothetical protein
LGLLLALWCALVVLPGVIIAGVAPPGLYGTIDGWILGGWILGFVAQIVVFMVVCRISGRNNVIGWLIASLAPFASDWGTPATPWGPVAAAVLSVGFAVWFYWSCSRQSDLAEHGVPAVGEVVSVKDPLMNMIINGAYIRRTLRLKVIRPDGVAPYESNLAGTFMIGNIPDPGDRFNLRVDPKNPQRIEIVDGSATPSGAGGGDGFTAHQGDYPGGGPASSGIADQLAQLAGLHRAGQLTDAEFSAAKARLLGR